MHVVSINISHGGIPKRPVASTMVRVGGLEHDAHNHEKHRGPQVAVSLLDLEMIEALVREGFSLEPGSTGENLTLSAVDVQSMTVGDRLRFINPDGTGGPEIELTKKRKPCYVLDSIDPRLKVAAVDRIGFLGRVVTEGRLERGATVVPMRATASAEA